MNWVKRYKEWVSLVLVGGVCRLFALIVALWPALVAIAFAGEMLRGTQELQGPAKVRPL